MSGIRVSGEIAHDLADYLEHLKAGLNAPAAANLPVTVVCVARHGYATTRVSLESLYAETPTPFVVVYLDINSPPVVREYLADQARVRDHFFHVRIDEHVSRQSARLLVLDMIPTLFTVFVDNNMLFGDGWLEHLIRTSENDHAAVVSPLITMQGGRVHFSGSTVERLADGRCKRRQTTAAAPMTARLEESAPEKMEIDFAESHCCLVRTECFRGRAAEFFLEDMHNCHTMAVATQRMQKQPGGRLLIEPESLVSILPIGAGYDFPWLFECYNNLELYKASYARHEQEVGRSVSTTLANLRWHRKHLLYLLLTMTENSNLDRSDMLRWEEVPAEVVGYDKALPDDILYRIRKQVQPFVDARFPRYKRLLDMWMYEINEVIECIDSRINEPVAAPMPRERLGVSIVICTYNGATLLPEALESIAALENDAGRDWELIVVDNASTDDTARIARESCPPQIRDRLTVLSEPRLGVMFARLKGLYSARHEIVGFIDDDNRPCTDWLETTARLMEARPEVGVVGTYTEAVFGAEPPSWFTAVKHQFAVGGQGSDVGDVTWRRGYVWGAGSSYRRRALKAVIERYGDPVLTGRRGHRVLASGEDSEFCCRLKAAGWKIWYDPSIKIRHYIPERKLNWSYVCRMNTGFGAAAVRLANCKDGVLSDTNPRRPRSWQHALYREISNLWKSKVPVARIVLGRGHGDPSVLKVYRALGGIMELLRLRKRYDASIVHDAGIVPDRDRYTNRTDAG